MPPTPIEPIAAPTRSNHTPQPDAATRRFARRRRGRFAPPAIAALFALATPALAHAAPAGAENTITAIGFGQAPVRPADRHNNTSIVAAVEAAEAKAIPRALDDAREHATALARSAGLTLGRPLNIDQTQPPFYGPFYGYPFVPFGPDRYCGQVRRPIVTHRNGHRHVVGVHRVRVCRPPQQVISTLTVTFAAG
jgi:hypothetical protein